MDSVIYVEINLDTHARACTETQGRAADSDVRSGQITHTAAEWADRRTLFVCVGVITSLHVGSS